MSKTTEQKAAETRAEARKHREQNYAVKRVAGFECGEPACKATSQLLVVELPPDEEDPGEGDFKLGVRCTLHTGELPIRPFQFNEGAPPDLAA